MRAQHTVHVFLLLWVVIWSCHARGMDTMVEKDKPVIDVRLLKKDLKTQLVLTFLYLTTTNIVEEDYFFNTENAHPLYLLMTLLEHIEESKLDSLSSKTIRALSIAFFEIYLSASIFTAQPPEETQFMSTFWESYSKDRYMTDIDITEEHLLILQAFSKKKVIALLNTFKELIFLQKITNKNKKIIQRQHQMYHSFLRRFRTACFKQIAQSMATTISTFSHDDLKEELQQQLKINYSQAKDLATHIKELPVEEIARIIRKEYRDKNNAWTRSFAAIFLPNERIYMYDNKFNDFTRKEKIYLYKHYKSMPKNMQTVLDVAIQFDFRNYLRLDPIVEALQAEFTPDTIENLYQALGNTL